MGAITSQELSFEKCVEIFEYHKKMYSTRFYEGDKFFMLVCRGFYLDSIGAKGKNDQNVYDDFWLAGNIETGFNLAVKGNADPSFANKKHAKLRIGVIRYYRGNHKGEYLAFRPYPEGVRIACTRDGVPSDCANTNAHGGKDIADGVGYDTWSEGCITQPISFFKSTFQPQCYAQIENHHDTIDHKHINERYLAEKKKGLGTKHFPLILIEKRLDASGTPKLYSATGEVL